MLYLGVRWNQGSEVSESHDRAAPHFFGRALGVFGRSGVFLMTRAKRNRFFSSNFVEPITGYHLQGLAPNVWQWWCLVCSLSEVQLG